MYSNRRINSPSGVDFKEDNLGEDEAEFCINFAWSCWSCLFEGYPNGKECVTLEWACKEYNVSVEIKSEECGMGFEETIYGTPEGVSYSSEEMSTYICECGQEEQIASNYDLDDYECCECGKTGKWRPIFEEQ